MGETPARHHGAIGVCTLAVVSMVLIIAWHNVSLRGQLDVALAEERLLRGREQEAVEERRLSLVRQEGQKLFDGARVAVAAGDWPQARLQLEKALTTIGSEAPLESLKASAQTLLEQVEQELRAEANRKEAQARFQQFVKLRNEAQFLGTLYTGMDLALNLQAARASVQQALEVYGVLREANARPALDADLNDAQRAEVLGDCYQLLLILAETEAQSTSDQKPSEKETLPASSPQLPRSRPNLRNAFPSVSPEACALPEDARQAGRSGAGRAGGRQGVP